MGLLIGLLATGCDQGLVNDIAEQNGIAGRMHTAVLRAGQILSRETRAIMESELVTGPRTDSTRFIPALDLVPPDDSVSHWIESCQTTRSFCDQRRDVVVSFKETLSLPIFPDPLLTEPPDSPTNLDRLRTAASIRDSLLHGHKIHLNGLFDHLEVEADIDEFFWIANATLITVRVGDLAKILADTTVQYVESRFPDHPPPLPNMVGSGASTRERGAPVSAHLTSIPVGAPTVSDGRGIIGSDAYFELDSRNGMRGWIGLLDTGIRYTHTLLAHSEQGSSNVRFIRDCTFGNGSCVDFELGERPAVWRTGPASDSANPAECGEYVGHGTASAAVIAGNASLGDSFRGVTGHVLDFYKIYDCVDGFPQTDTAAFLRALEAAITNLDKVVLAELPVVPRRFHSIVLVAADRAFDLGSVVVAPVGNTRGEVFAPAYGRRVIASGALEIARPIGDQGLTLRQFDQQGHGPTPDGRTKPDIQAPTNTWTAGNCSGRGTAALCSDSTLIHYQMTSGAAPYTAAAASLLRNFIAYGSNRSHVDPGGVYAHLILSGQQSFPFPDSAGAGLIRLPALDGSRYWGEVSLSAGQHFDVPIALSDSDTSQLDAALWWPNPKQYLSVTAPGNDVDLEILNSEGEPAAVSRSKRNSFERARATATGHEWTVRIIARTVHAQKQQVYWAVHAAGR